ncbi:Pycsar system effector family protein [Actinokineospora iranica]|uniref:Pycsar effector protein domain-containing protein n=1 Tax=Actinokineospora iranica TaxID=1271860 RepID=A0A1G6WRS6_9PSEU|nr:Pycsar system effector family protein [Actinokineospora iranica]SDD68484.1 hypothetical protein SAMN05216174_115139 [Actinokineospora iranica]
MSGVAERLAVTHEQARDELRRADAKATTLLSLVGAALAGVIALSGRSLPIAASVTLWVSAAPILVSVLLLLSAIRPRLGPTEPAPGTWLYAAAFGPSALLKSLADENESAMSRAVHACELGVIAQAKYDRIRRAVGLLVLGLGVLVLALVLSVVAR